MLPVEGQKKDDDDDPVFLLTLNSETSVPWDELEGKVCLPSGTRPLWISIVHTHTRYPLSHRGESWLSISRSRPRN